MEEKYPSVQKFTKLGKWEKYEMVSKMRDIAVRRRSVYSKNLRGDTKYRNHLNKNFLKSYEKLMGEVGVYKRGALAGHLKNIPLNVSNKRLIELYQSYSMFMKTDLYSREGRKSFEERGQKVLEKIKNYQQFENFSDAEIQNVLQLYNKMGSDLVEKYGSNNINPLYETYGGELDDELIINVLEDELRNGGDVDDAALRVHQHLMPRLLSVEIDDWQERLDDIGYTTHSAEELVKLATKGKLMGYDMQRAVSREDAVDYVEHAIRKLERKHKK